MRGSPPSFPPPEDAAARYDAVLRRGRSLRRRHQVAVGAGTGGLVALVLLVVVVATGGRGGTKDDQVVTDPRPTITTSTTTTTTTKPTFAVTATASATKVTVTVSDPDFPVAADSKQCAFVRVAPAGPSGIATAETLACAGADQPDVTTALVSPTPGVELGCSGITESNPPAIAPPPSPTKPESHTFTFTLPQGRLEPGLYAVEASGTSGIGNGCADQQDGENEEAGQAPPTTFTVGG